jgi:hypothetical protein
LPQLIQFYTPLGTLLRDRRAVGLILKALVSSDSGDNAGRHRHRQNPVRRRRRPFSAYSQAELCERCASPASETLPVAASVAAYQQAY